IPSGIDDTDLELEGDIHLLEELLNNDPSLTHLPPKELNVEEIKTVKSFIDEPPELKLKRRQRSPVPTERLPIDACLSACAMHRALFKGVCWLFSMTWLRRRWKSLWTTSRSLGILLKIASLV
nr:reverse transcriptase domain-containing protein [Tanacetum cinerariifolium]